MATGRVDVFRKGSLGLSKGDYGSRLSSDVEGMFDDELHPTKKRKVSPGIWDLEGKSKGSGSRLVVDDSDVESVYPQREGNDVGDFELEEGEVEDEGIQARDVLMSRWSSESPDDRYGSGDELEHGKHRGNCSDESLVIDKKRVTPESGELRRQDSEERKYVCSGRSHSESSSDFVETVERNGSIARMDMDSDDECGFDWVEEPISTMGRSINMLQSCRNAFEFEKLNKINEGTYGVVYRARDKKTGEIVALKKVKMSAEREGFPLTSLREINILLSFDHPSIVGVKEVVMDDHDNVYMVMEHMEHDLKGVMEVMKHPFSTSEVKCLMLQLLGGVKYLHDNWVIHRDLKTSNILFNNSGELKICDFGMSRQYGSPLKPYTPLVVTLWYRAPEVLLGTKQYSEAIDMWSVGCIMAELLTRDPLFKGKAELDQLDKICRLLGTPDETIWPGLSKLPGAKPTVNQRYNLLRKKFPAASFTGSAVLSDSGFDLLSRLLTYDPEKRITAEDALNHPWFHEIPHPKSKDFMPTFPARHAKRDL